MAIRSISLPLPMAETASEASERAGSLEARALAGDEAAWDELFRRHNRQVVLALLARRVRPDAARDLAQEAWIRLIEQQRRGRLPELALPGLAITQAMFLARDRARHGDARYRHVSLEQAGGGDAVRDAAIDPEGALVARDRLARARAVLATCGDSHRRVFRAMYGGVERSAAEVAQTTGLSVQRVRQIMCEVRKKLRAALEDRDG
jgi:RNA polymerase sigma factor (sigma-70 family)